MRPVETGDARIAEPEIVGQIEKGVTKERVEALVGKPEKVDFTDAGYEKWEYVYGRYESRGSAFSPQVVTDAHTLTILFDADGRVLRVGKGEQENVN